MKKSLQTSRPKPKRRTKKQQKERVHVVPPYSSDSTVSRFSYVLELGSAPVWEYLSLGDISNLFHVCADSFSPDFIDAAALKAINQFAVENKTHLGLQCGCDWMRSLGFDVRSNDRCVDTSPFSVDKTLPIFQVPGGPRSLLAALVLTKKLMQPFFSAKIFKDAVFAPIVCPLTTRETPILSSKAAIIRAMNNIFPGAGSRYFYTYKLSSERTYADYIEQHWSGMNGSLCQYCVGLTGPSARRSKRFGTWMRTEINKIRANCTKRYQPLKTALEKNLQHVRFIRQRRRRLHDDVDLRFEGYEGLVAGITESGVLCGLYVVSGYNPSRAG